jgi:hypothetical protein
MRSSFGRSGRQEFAHAGEADAPSSAQAMLQATVTLKDDRVTRLAIASDFFCGPNSAG